jgi:hypothetical protein
VVSTASVLIAATLAVSTAVLARDALQGALPDASVREDFII